MSKKIAFFIFLMFIFSSLTVQAQNIDSATRELDRGVREKVADELTPRPKPAPIKKELERPEPSGQKFFLKEITITGNDSIPEYKFAGIFSEYKNKEVHLSDVHFMAKQVQREYLKNMIIASCRVPPQDVTSGVVTLDVTEAKMGELLIKKTKWFDKGTYKRLWDLQPGEVLRYDKLRRSMILMNENPDRTVSANLKAGKQPGTTDVIIDGDTKFPVHPTSSYDNEGARSTGKDRIGFGVRHNNFLFVGDTFIGGYSFGEYFSGFYLYHSVPITDIGTSIMYGYNESRAKPNKEFSEFGIKSLVRNASLFIYQDIFYKAEYLGEFSIGVESKDKTTNYSQGALNRDRLRIIRTQLNLMFRTFGGITYLTPQFSQGLNFLGARRKNNFSSRAAGNVFSKFNLSVRHKRKLPLNLTMNLTFKSQMASEKLTPQEEYFLGGIDSVRGYPSGDFLADNAVQANVEILSNFFFIPEDIKLPYDKRSLKDNLTGLVFFDYGWGEKRGAMPSEKNRANFSSVGAGIRIRLYERALLRLEWGFPLSDRPITETADSRFHMSLNFEL